MKLTRRYRRWFLYLSFGSVYILISLLLLCSIHFVWCATKYKCTHRLFCPPDKIILRSNITPILESTQSLCSARSAQRGPHQRVIGVSAYLSKEDNRKLFPKIWTYLLQYIEEANDKYPEWIVRVYHHRLNVSKEDIFQIEEKYRNVDFCDSTNIPMFGNILHWLPGKMQRFLPLADSLVDTYMSRDIDSPILERETTIIRAWLDSKYTVHIIRDHPEHAIPILGGLWGLKLDKERLWVRNISQYLLSPDVVQCYTGAGDQTFLEDFVWPHASTYDEMTLEYDSFHCNTYPNSRPFPTRKESPTRFVGCRRPNCTQDKHSECPQQCRSPHHPDWIWC